jgi:hypothetical protein
MADTTVKFLHSAMSGAPVLNGTAGAMIGLLDACLVDGFGSGTVDSVVIASGVATVTRSAGHPMEVGSVSLISGATVSGGSINGEQKVLSVTATTYTFDATGISNQTATGTISHKLSAAGWTKQYSGTNLAAYKSSDVAANGNLLRVDDTNAQYARCIGYETMSDVNTGTGLFPTTAQLSGGVYWPKSQASDSTSRPWILVADSRIVYLMVGYTSTSSVAFGFNHVFGDINSVKSPDVYATVLNGFASAVFGTNGANGGLDYDHADALNPGTGLYMTRAYTGLGSSIKPRKNFPSICGNTATKSGGSNGFMAFPNYADGGLYVVSHYLIDDSSQVVRGVSPGLYCAPQYITNQVFSNRDPVTGVTGLTGKTLKAVNSNTGVFFFDITGPWR